MINTSLYIVILILVLMFVFIFLLYLRNRNHNSRSPKMDEKNRKKMQVDFSERFQKMLKLVARGRGIEILLRIADQTNEGLANVDESYETMMNSDIRIPNVHPPMVLPKLFSDSEERKRLELSRDISDKLAHGIYRQARKLIDKYRNKYGLQTKLNKKPLPGWRIDAAGHLTEVDGKKILSIVDTLNSSADNLIVEEFDVFTFNNYEEAAYEIFDDAWKRVDAAMGSLAIRNAKLHMFRGFKRGKRTYVGENEG